MLNIAFYNRFVLSMIKHRNKKRCKTRTWNSNVQYDEVSCISLALKLINFAHFTLIKYEPHNFIYKQKHLVFYYFPNPRLSRQSHLFKEKKKCTLIDKINLVSLEIQILNFWIQKSISTESAISFKARSQLW